MWWWCTVGDNEQSGLTGEEYWCVFEGWKWDLCGSPPPPWSSGGAELVLVGMNPCRSQSAKTKKTSSSATNNKSKLCIKWGLTGLVLGLGFAARTLLAASAENIVGEWEGGLAQFRRRSAKTILSPGIICTLLVPISRFPELPGVPFLLFPVVGDAVATVAGPASEFLPLSSAACFDIE
jgi:hypothetical protein